MGSAPSTPRGESTSAMTEKYTAAASGTRRADAALQALVGLSKKAPATASITHDAISVWDDKFKRDPKSRFASTVINKTDLLGALINRDATIADQMVFNVTLSEENQVVSNQKSSGRCWLFATTNTIRLQMQRKYGLKDFQLSQSYLFFYDSLSKANWFLENMLDLAEEDLDSRIIQYLMVAPENDGGQWDMAVNVVETFGLVPQAVYPESFNSSNTGKLDALLTTKLREYALELRELYDAAKSSLDEFEGKTQSEKRAIATQSARKRKEEQMEEVYRILAITLGAPPKANEEFTWEYYSGEGKTRKYHKITSTPLKFYKEYAQVDVSRGISLINDPRNDYNKLYTVDRLGNVVGGRPVLYVNAEVKELKKVAIELLKNDTPVWFGCDVGQSSNSALGIMDTRLFDIEACFGTSSKLTKAQRIATGDSSMTHAMVLTAVKLDENGNDVAWRVENSWGPDACDKGYMVMTSEWFDEHVFQIVADRKVVPKALARIFEEQQNSPVVLPAWDPMGALA